MPLLSSCKYLPPPPHAGIWAEHLWEPRWRNAYTAWNNPMPESMRSTSLRIADEAAVLAGPAGPPEPGPISPTPGSSNASNAELFPVAPRVGGRGVDDPRAASWRNQCSGRRSEAGIKPRAEHPSAAQAVRVRHPQAARGRGWRVGGTAQKGPASGGHCPSTRRLRSGGSARKPATSPRPTPEGEGRI